MNEKTRRMIAQIVARKLGRDFENIKIHKVGVRTDVDRDGDEILLIEVVFDGTLKGVDVASATRRLRPALHEEGETDLYPLLSFVSKVDHDKGRSRSEAN